MGMSGSTYDARRNQITAGYYFFLRGQINRGLSSKQVYAVEQQDGSFAYFLREV